ncbi:hypothetical protein SSP24_75850 [Streptomyces spinoverrucosus]|uniref:Uncharacterized protein n=1 Tax=Streptomyces spinoverrucosus TaxID=284043 RepID=A0A4Y3VW96_9ACTN|nr:hypothetical protein SSP24_75850 [Streptomyces spinoverrucosus]GHB66751.1 hypothetical protein GCM10010397_41250 [Streptomyces spinoverrucosus]
MPNAVSLAPTTRLADRHVRVPEHGGSAANAVRSVDMPCVPRALARLRGRVFGRRPPGRHVRTTPIPAVPPDLTGRPSPEMWAAILAGARRRRTAHRWPSGAATVWEPETSALVRAYVLAPEERPQELAAPSWEA